MKKLFFMFMMMLAVISMASCSGNAGGDEATKDLAAQLESGDVNKFQAALEAVKAKATELLAQNPEKAKELIASVQKFLNDNKEKVTALIGSNETVSNLVNTITSASADDVINTLSGALGGAQDKAEGLMDDAQQKAGELLEGAEDQAGEMLEDAQQKAGELIDGANDKLQDATQKADETIKGAIGL